MKHRGIISALALTGACLNTVRNAPAAAISSTPAASTPYTPISPVGPKAFLRLVETTHAPAAIMTLDDAVLPIVGSPAPPATIVAAPPVAATPEPAPLQLPPPIDPGDLRGRALARFVELGAAPWQVAMFDCIGRNESGWQNVRGRWSPDSGVLQINDVHLPLLHDLGLDPWVPEDAATFAWQLSRQGRNFSPWTVVSVHHLC